MERTRRQFSPEFKREAAQLALRPGVSKAQVAKDVGVNQSVLRLWLQQFGVREIGGSPPTTMQER